MATKKTDTHAPLETSTPVRARAFQENPDRPAGAPSPSGGARGRGRRSIPAGTLVVVAGLAMAPPPAVAGDDAPQSPPRTGMSRAGAAGGPQTRPSETVGRSPAQTRPARPEPEVKAIIDGEPVMQLIPPDSMIPAIDDPHLVTAAEAGSFMKDDEMVLGVFDGREARAYSVWHLDRHEVVNDRLAETPIAATW